MALESDIRELTIQARSSFSKRFVTFTITQ